MALVITSPKNVIIDIENGQNTIIWTNSTYGQTSYEIQYKFKDDDEWNSCGRVFNSSTRSVSTEEIYRRCPYNFYEIYYRVITYYNENGMNGYEISDTYIIIFRFQKVNTLKIWLGDSVGTYPLYETVNLDSNKEYVLKQQIALTELGEKLSMPLVDKYHALASDLEVCITISPKVVKYAVTEEPNFVDPDIPGGLYFS